MEQKPSVGRIVHYKENKENAECKAAIITKVNDDSSVVLQIFEPFTIQHIFATADYKGVNPLSALVGEWHWPERI